LRKRHIASAIKSFRPSKLKMVITLIGFVLIMQALKQIFGRLWQFCSVVCGEFVRSFVEIYRPVSSSSKHLRINFFAHCQLLSIHYRKTYRSLIWEQFVIKS